MSIISLLFVADYDALLTLSPRSKHMPRPGGRIVSKHPSLPTSTFQGSSSSVQSPCHLVIISMHRTKQ
ncbi:hypothetical protein MY3296_001183 [Beauveria thailandica]